MEASRDTLGVADTADVTVMVYVNGELKAEVKVGSGGTFNVSVEIEVEGTNTIEVSYVDLAGNVTAKARYGEISATKLM